MSVLGETVCDDKPATQHTLTIGERSVTVKMIDQGVKLAFERAFYAAARQREESQCLDELTTAIASGLSADAIDRLQQQHEARLDDLKDDYQCGKFALLSRRGRKAIAEPEGLVRLLTLIMSATEQEVIAALSDRAKQAEINSILSAVIAESFPGMVEAKGLVNTNGTGKKKD